MNLSCKEYDYANLHIMKILVTKASKKSIINYYWILNNSRTPSHKQGGQILTNSKELYIQFDIFESWYINGTDYIGMKISCLKRYSSLLGIQRLCTVHKNWD